MEQVFIVDGKLVPREEIFKGNSWSSSEGKILSTCPKAFLRSWALWCQLSRSKHQPFPNAQCLQFLLQIRMLLRLIPGRVGDGTAHCYSSVKNGFDSAILTKIPRMKKGEKGWVDAEGLNTCARGNAPQHPRHNRFERYRLRLVDALYY
jgi:hypothetical protein